jgi:voltage-dependent anion channel protein 2
MATKFFDIAKGPKDLLNDDYSTKQTLKCKKNAGPVAVTIETSRGEGGALTSKIGTKFNYGKLNIDKAQATADGGQVLETSLKVAPNMKVSFKSGKGADLGIDYYKGNLYATGVLDVVEMSKFSTSACVSLPSGVKAGADATYGLSGKTGVNSLNIGASYATGSLFGAVTSVNKFSSVNLGLLYKVNSQVTVASMSSHSGDSAFSLTAVGGSYKAGFGTIKAKYTAGGVISASLVKDIAPKVSLTASGSASASDPAATFKYGIGVTM